jgi:hypothetical protein
LKTNHLASLHPLGNWIQTLNTKFSATLRQNVDSQIADSQNVDGQIADCQNVDGQIADRQNVDIANKCTLT